MNDHPSRFGGSGGDRIDRAIDRAVRDMMWIDPPAGLRRRVLSRLEAPARRASLFPRFALAAAALAVLAIGAVLLRQGPPPATVSPSTVTVAAPPKTVEPNVRLNPPAPPVVERAAPRRTAARRDGLIRMPAIANVFGPPDGRVAGASVAEPGAVRPAGIEPGTSADATPAIFPSSTPSPSQIDELIIPPLEVKPLQIAPLPPRK